MGYAFPYMGFEKLSSGAKCFGLSGGNSLYYGSSIRGLKIEWGLVPGSAYGARVNGLQHETECIQAGDVGTWKR
jgi:hypothetical protein